MELLIVKSDQDYIRFKDNGFLRVRLDKASVFPMNRIEQVRQHETHLKELGFKKVCINKLILTEEEL